MRNSRTVLMIFTGIILAFVIWIIAANLRSKEQSETTQSSPEVTMNFVLEENALSPAIVVNGHQDGDQFIISGHGMAGAHIELSDRNAVLANTHIGDDGTWQVSLAEFALNPHHVVHIYMNLPSGERLRSDQVLVFVKNVETSGPDTKGRALVFLTAPGGKSSVLQTPFEGFPGANGFYLDAIDYDNSGGVIFSGTSIKRGKVGIYASKNLVGESSVDASGRWSLIFGNIMPLGAYKISAKLMPNDGSASIMVDLPFERMSPLEQEAASPDIKVEYLTDRIQIARSILGGGYQYTVIYAPIAARP